MYCYSKIGSGSVFDYIVGHPSTEMETLIKLGKIGLGVCMTVIPGTYAFTESVGYVARVDGISMQVCVMLICYLMEGFLEL
jgi:hypothetical protein